jgi:hypothetical protein
MVHCKKIGWLMVADHSGDCGGGISYVTLCKLNMSSFSLLVVGK